MLSHPAVLRLPGVVRRLLLGGPAEDRHELLVRGAILGRNCGPCFSEAVEGAMRQLCLVAPVPHFVAKRINGERFLPLRRQESQLTASAGVDGRP